MSHKEESKVHRAVVRAQTYCLTDIDTGSIRHGNASCAKQKASDGELQHISFNINPLILLILVGYWNCLDRGMHNDDI
ncbi:MAG: hypothetical protein LBQ03_02660, partial [Puniceicoccales bacterium]|nr:hypothetical protein [Puniceicoccales bacterium]